MILNVYDGYMSGSNQLDLAVDVEDAFAKICELSFCHRSQIMEWLPWVNRHDLKAPETMADWTQIMRRRFQKKHRELEIPTARAMEVFTVTAWGEVPTFARLEQDFPNLAPAVSRFDQLKAKLNRWRGE